MEAVSLAAPISIIIPAFNQVEYCRQCVQSVLLNTRHPYELILVDNGSTDGVPAFFDSVPGATVVHSETNLGFAGGVNLGLERAAGHALLLNSDTIVPSGWLERLAAALLRSDDAGMVGPMSNCVSGTQKIDGLDLNSLVEIDAFSDDLAARNAGRLRDVARLVGFCLLIRDRVLAEVGRFDDAYGIGNFEDDDYCLRVLRAGYRLCVAEDSFVFHYGSRTFVGMGILDDKWRALIDANGRRFEAKWDTKPEERSDAIQESRQWNRQARAAFDAGDSVEALRRYKQAVEAAPFYEVNYNDLGVLLWQLGERDRAFDHFLRAVRLNTHYADGRANLADAAEALGRGGEAAELLGVAGEERRK